VKNLLLTIIALGLFGVFAAGQITSRADKRQKNQKHRVKNGVKSGEITNREAKSIKSGTKTVNRYEAKEKSDGKIRWKERAGLQPKEKRASRKIYRMKKNKK
jgi:Ni/Co efflux regulator RcnB